MLLILVRGIPTILKKYQEVLSNPSGRTNVSIDTQTGLGFLLFLAQLIKKLTKIYFELPIKTVTSSYSIQLVHYLLGTT